MGVVISDHHGQVTSAACKKLGKIYGFAATNLMLQD